MDNVTLFTQRQSHLVSNETLQRFQTILSVFRCVISVMGLCTNVLNLNTFIKVGLDETVTISFFALAVSDFFYCSLATVGLVPLLMSIAERNYSLYFYLPPNIVAFYIVCVRRIFSVTSVLITTFLAIQRCLCVVLPFQVKSVFTRFRTFCFVAIIFTFSLICHTLYIFPHRIREFHSHKHNATQLEWYLIPDSDQFVFPMAVLIGVAMNFGCQAVVLVSLVVMGIGLRRSLRFRKSVTIDARTNETKTKETPKEIQALIQVSIVSGIFFTMNLPYIGFGITNLLVEDFGLGLAWRNFHRMFHNIMTMSELCNASVNFFVYFKCNSKFRACFSLTQKSC